MSLRRKLRRMEHERRPPAEHAAPAAARPDTSQDVSGRSEPSTTMGRPVAERAGVLEQLRSTLRAMEARSERRRVPAPPPAPVPGESVDTDLGRLQLVTRCYGAGARHGGASIDAGRDVPGGTLAKLSLDASFRELESGGALYVDTETTGLAGGSGTIPFLIGFGRFTAEGFVVEQCLLERLGEEAPMLERLRARIAEATMVVSYNGKSFDWPLLRTRFVMARMAVPPLPPHLDLLHASRRLFKPRLGRTRLVDMERELLAYERVGDIDGALIPKVFFDFLKGRDQGAMAQVVRHNQDDLAALAALLGRLVALANAEQDLEHPEDALAMARVLWRAGDAEAAERFARHASEAGEPGMAAEAELLRGRWAKRRGDVSLAEACFERAIALGADDTVAASAHLALAKLCEHQLRDLERALLHAERAVEAEGEDAAERRLGRLRAKLERASG